MRIGNSNGRKDLMNQSRLSTGVPHDIMKMGSQSVEPAFRVYGKNQAAREFNDMIKVKHKVRLAGLGTVESGGTSADFSFRARTGNQKVSPRTELISRSYNREHPYQMSQGGTHPLVNSGPKQQSNQMTAKFTTK